MAPRAAVWLADIGGLSEAAVASYWALLSPGEQERRFVRPQRRRQFVAARVLLRMALGSLLNVPASAVVLGGQAGRAPWLIAPDVPLVGLSVSHSGDWVACAVSLGCALGLDIELLDGSRDIAALAAQAFDEATCARFAALPAHERLHAFYGAWSAQEARIKLGEGPAACYQLPHAALAVELCSAAALAEAPALRMVQL